MTAHNLCGAPLTGAHRSPVALQTLIQDMFLQQAHVAFITVYNYLGESHRDVEFVRVKPAR